MRIILPAAFCCAAALLIWQVWPGFPVAGVLPGQALFADYQGNTVRAQLLLRPGSTSQVQEIVGWAGREEHFLRIRGAGHSMSGQSLPRVVSGRQEVLLETSGLNQFRDQGLEKTGCLEVGAGVPVASIRKWNLQEHSWWIPVLPDSDGPTAGGYAVSGGVNAASFRYGGFWDNLCSLELVDGRGEVHKLDPAHPDFPWMFANRGSLGIITRLWLRPSRLKKSSLQSISWEGSYELPDLMENLKQLQQGKSAHWLMTNYQHGTFSSRLKTTRSLDLQILRRNGIPASRQELDPGTSPEGNLGWLNLLCPDKSFADCFGGLKTLLEEHPKRYIGIYFYRIASRSVPPLLGPPGDFWIIGLWWSRQKVDSGQQKKLEGKFESLRRKIGVYRYPGAETFHQAVSFWGYYPDKVMKTWTALQKKYHSWNLLNRTGTHF
jgi:hypothetical protein